MINLHAASRVLESYAPSSFSQDSSSRLSAKVRSLTHANQNLKTALLNCKSPHLELRQNAIVCCKETREVAFFADLQAMILDDENTRQLIGSCLEAICETGQLLHDVSDRIKSDFPPITRYIESTEKRRKRLDSIIKEGIAAAHLRMASETSIQAIKTASNSMDVVISTKGESLLFAIAQWYGHRLVCLIAELSLESGPYHDALCQYADLISKSIQDVDPFVQALEKESLGDCVSPLKHEVDETEKFLSEMLNAILSFIDESTSAGESADKENAARNAVVSIVNSFQHRHQALNQAVDTFCDNHFATDNQSASVETFEVVEFVEDTSSDPATSRVLLVRENDERGAWTALGLDYPIVVFGDEIESAVRAYEDALNGPLKPKKRRTSLLAYENLYKNLDDATEFDQVRVRVLEPIQQPSLDRSI